MRIKRLVSLQTNLSAARSIEQQLNDTLQKIYDAHQAGKTQLATQLGTQLDNSLNNTSIRYTFDVFEDADLSAAINRSLSMEYGADQIAVKRDNLFDGRTIVRASNSDVGTVHSRSRGFK